MPSMTISRQIFACLLLILLSQYGDATKSQYLESILATLERIEKGIKRNSDFGCVVPCKYLNSGLERPRLLEAEHLQLDNAAYRKLSSHDAESLNANVNINGHPYTRRNFDKSVMSSNKIANQNVNMYGEPRERHYAKLSRYGDDY